MPRDVWLYQGFIGPAHSDTTLVDQSWREELPPLVPLQAPPSLGSFDIPIEALPIAVFTPTEDTFLVPLLMPEILGRTEFFYGDVPKANFTAKIGGLFVYTASHWEDDVEHVFEACFRATTGLVFARLIDITIGGANAVIFSKVMTSSPTLILARSIPLTLIDGHVYQVQTGKANSVGSVGFRISCTLHHI